MAKTFAEDLAKFMAQHKRVDLTERIDALRQQKMWLELDRDAKVNRAVERAYGKQLLMSAKT